MAVKPKKKTVSKVAEAVKKEDAGNSSSVSENLQKPVAEEMSSQVLNNNPSENKTEIKQETKLEVSTNADELSSTDCRLHKQQVEKAVSIAFRAYRVSKEKSSSGNLFEDDAESINLLVSSIKVDNREPRPIMVKLPHPTYTKESDICLIVQDLEKGWKVDHEPTLQHYKELLQSNGIDYISEVVPLRQLRVEYKPYEARAKLAKRFDVVLIDKKIGKFVPRYLGKAFYQYGKLPIPVDMHANNVKKELKKSLAMSTMSMTNNGASTCIRVGSTTFTEESVTENIMAVCKKLNSKFPGKFANIRSLCLRVGRQSWTVPVYVSLASRETVVLPPPRQDATPLVDDLTTLRPGMKVAVYKSGEVKVVKDKNYQRTPLDDEEGEEEKVKLAKSGKNQKRSNDDEDEENDHLLSESDGIEEDLSDIESDGDESEVENSKKVDRAHEKKAVTQQTEDDSSDDGDALEDEYMEELALMEEEEGGAKPDGGNDTESEPPAKKSKGKGVPAEKIAKSKTKKLKTK